MPISFGIYAEEDFLKILAAWVMDDQSIHFEQAIYKEPTNLDYMTSLLGDFALVGFRS